MRTRRMSLAAGLCLALAACVPDGAPVSVAPSAAAGGVGVVANAAPVSPARAKAIFDGVCGASLPNFDAAPKLMAANGFTRPSAMGTATIYSNSENASFQILDGPGLGKTCSLVVATKATPDALRLAVLGPAIGKAEGKTHIEYLGLYQGRKALVTSGRPTRVGGLTYINFQMLSER